MDELTVTDKNNTTLINPYENPQRWQEMMAMATSLSKTAIIPAAYSGKPEDCLIAIEMANRMNVSPLFVMQNLYVVRGRPSWSGQACMALIKGSNEFKDVKPVYTGEKGKDSWGCYVEAVRIKDSEVVKGAEVTVGIAKKEGWFSKKDKFGNETSKWQTMPELMLAYRAAAFFARVHIPNALMGCQVEGEAEDIAPAAKPVAVDPFQNTENKEDVKGESNDIN